MNPSHNGCMSYIQASLLHHLHKHSVTQWIFKIPANAQYYYFRLEMFPFK